MKRHLVVAAAFLSFTLTACAGGYKRLGPELRLLPEPLPPGAPAGQLKFGLVADSQFQSKFGALEVPFYKGRKEDFIDVALRPPALDWAARSLLWAQLSDLKAGGAEAVFYLGDGANNGCKDELTAPPRPGASEDFDLASWNEAGILPLLAAWRARNNVPVFFVLGNHDVLGGGNTSRNTFRSRLCDYRSGLPEVERNRPLMKFEVIDLVDAFNRDSAKLDPAWSYDSVLPERSATMQALCQAKDQDGMARQQRARGCYLAAVARHRTSAAGDVAFLLIDSTDLVDAPDLIQNGHELEGLRGGISSVADPQKPIPQTAWLAAQGAGADTRLGLSHYDLPALRTRIGPYEYSQNGRRMLEIFIDPTARAPRQPSAYFLSAHTHATRNTVRTERFPRSCNGCERWEPWTLQELNIGSTTDYGNRAALLTLNGAPGVGGRLTATTQTAVGADCDAIRERLKRQGLARVALDPRHPKRYRAFSHADNQAVMTRLDEFTQSWKEAVCVGLMAAALEAGHAKPRGLTKVLPPEVSRPLQEP